MLRIITDSTACLERRDARVLSVRVVPVGYTIDGRCFSEGYSDENGPFERLLASSKEAGTLRPDAEVFHKVFSEELRDGAEVICITISSRLSGVFSSASIAAGRLAGSAVSTFDSRLTAGGLLLMLREVRRLADEGRGLAEIMDILPRIRENIISAFSVGDMEPLRKSGRIGFVRMSVGTILNIRPILLCRDGVVVSQSVARGDGDILRQLLEPVTQSARAAIVNYLGCYDLAREVYAAVMAKCPGVPVLLRKLGPVLGIHLGEQVVALSFLTD